MITINIQRAYLFVSTVHLIKNINNNWSLSKNFSGFGSSKFIENSKLILQ